MFPPERICARRVTSVSLGGSTPWVPTLLHSSPLCLGIGRPGVLEPLQVGMMPSVQGRADRRWA
jgi:hypothetical protein